MKERADFFLNPQHPRHRQYEALRAFYVDKLSASQVAEKFGYTLSSFNSLRRDFNKVDISFFVEAKSGPKKPLKKDVLREQVILLRKKNWSVYDIAEILEKGGHSLSHTAIAEILKEEGFARLPKRTLQQRNHLRRNNVTPPVASVSLLGSQATKQIQTDCGGLFVFIPLLMELHIEKLVEEAGYPGTKQIPALNYFLSLLALKLIDKERISHVDDLCLDEGAGLFAGLNVLPKSSSLSSYSYSIERKMNLGFTESLIANLQPQDLSPAEIFNLDFHSVPHFGEQSVLENHWVPQRGKNMKSVRTFFAQDGITRVFCYSNADIKKAEESGEILAFVDFWQRAKGDIPRYLIFDSKLTTYENLNRLKEKGIFFLTIRKRGKKLSEAIESIPQKQWTKLTLPNIKRAYRHPLTVESFVRLKDYQGEVRQIVAKNLGRESPTFFLTNDWKNSAEVLLTRYAQRATIENDLSSTIHFFHLNRLSSSIVIKVDFDVTQTLLAHTLYRQLASQLEGFEKCDAKQIFRKFLATRATIEVTSDVVTVCFPKRAHNPILMMAALDKKVDPIPWLLGRRLRFQFE